MQAFAPDMLVSDLPGGSDAEEALCVKVVTLEVGMARCSDTGQDPRSE